MDEKTHLIARGQRQARSKVALAYSARAGNEILHGSNEPLRGVDRTVNGGEHREQQHHRERESKTVFERLAQVRHFAVLGVAVLNRFRQLRKLRRHPIDGNEIAIVGCELRATERSGRAYEVTPVLLRLEAHVGAAFCNLSHEIRWRA